MRQALALAAFTLFVLSGQVNPTLAEQVAIAASRDNTLFENDEAILSNGIGQFLYSGSTNRNLRRRAVVAFDIASHVPHGATITGATLQLNLNHENSGIYTSTLHRLTQDWGEGNSNSSLRGGGGGAPAAANDATWLHTFFDGSLWTTPGGDFVAEPSASTEIGGDNTVLWTSTSFMVADLQAWLDAPATNFGWIIITDESTPTTAKRFDSRESLTAARRPILFVAYEGTTVQSATWRSIKALFL